MSASTCEFVSLKSLISSSSCLMSSSWSSPNTAAVALAQAHPSSVAVCSSPSYFQTRHRAQFYFVRQQYYSLHGSWLAAVQILDSCSSTMLSSAENTFRHLTVVLIAMKAGIHEKPYKWSGKQTQTTQTDGTVHSSSSHGNGIVITTG